MTVTTIGPKDFIRPPYGICPHCGKQSFGIWIVARDRYYRRCRECLHQGSSRVLPALNKRVIYLDQFAISNMMKATNPDTKAHRSGNLDPFYSELLRSLKRLTRMQLIVCPLSHTHTSESLASPFFKALGEFGERLSHGVRFRDAPTIRRFQLCQHAGNWIRGERDKPLELDIQTIVTGGMNVWPPDFHVAANLTYGDEVIEDLVRRRNEVYRISHERNGSTVWLQRAAE